MKHYFLFFLIVLLYGTQAFAQTDSSHRPGLRISLITCGPGDEIYSVFGHTAVRITDSSLGTDIVYNYGTFDGFAADFEIQFMRGKLLYYLSAERYDEFMDVYSGGNRWTQEQVLLLSEGQKQQIREYLQENLKPENRAYHYDFFFDNCATRIRDIFKNALGPSFRYPNVLPDGKGISYRTIINRYLRQAPLERMGVNILLGNKTDRIMSSSDIMFLPDYLRDGVAGATVGGKALAAPPEYLLKGTAPEVSGLNPVIITTWIIALLTILGLSVPALRSLGSVMSSLLLTITGMLGVLILLMWFGTDHQTCSSNLNLLWALPTNLLFLFRRKQHRYALIALILIFISLILHITGVQRLLLPEMTPLLLALLYIYTNAYRKGHLPATYGEKITQ